MEFFHMEVNKGLLILNLRFDTAFISEEFSVLFIGFSCVKIEKLTALIDSNFRNQFS